MIHPRTAVAYRSIGLSPVLLEGKKPVQPAWPVVSAKATEEDILRAFKRARANVGLLCGHWEHVLPLPDPTRIWIVAVDVDAKIFTFDPEQHPSSLQYFAGSTGLEALEMVEDKYGKLPDTWTQMTPTGGRHYVFRHPGGGARIPTRSGVWPGIDIRADDNGQIVAAPSIHPNGGQYVWEASSRPGEAELANLPAWLLGTIVGRARPDIGAAVGPASKSFLGRCFDVAGWLGYDIPNGHATARCPWWEEHSADARGKRSGQGGDSSTVILPPTDKRPLGTFHCRHSHGGVPKGTVAVLHALPVAAVRVVALDMPEEVQVALQLLRSVPRTP